MRIVLVLLAFLLPTASSAQEASERGSRLLPSSIAACIDALDEPVVGIEKLESECPGLGRALQDAELKPYLSDEQLNVLTPYGLKDLEQLVERYRSVDAPPAIASPDQLDPILEQLRKPTTEVPLTWFEKFKRWLRNLMNRQEQNTDSWLSRWLQDLDVPQAITQWILYGAVALVIVLAVAVVINELRAAGVLQAGSRRGSTAGHDGKSKEMLTAADLDSLSLRDQPAALLQRLVLALVRSGRLRAERSLTHRELGLRARFDANEQRHRFEQVALLGERLVYGNAAVSEEDIDQVVRDGRALERELAHAEARS